MCLFLYSLHKLFLAARKFINFISKLLPYNNTSNKIQKLIKRPAEKNHVIIAANIYSGWPEQAGK